MARLEQRKAKALKSVGRVCTRIHDHIHTRAQWPRRSSKWGFEQTAS